MTFLFCLVETTSPRLNNSCTASKNPLSLKVITGFRVFSSGTGGTLIQKLIADKGTQRTTGLLQKTIKPLGKYIIP